MRKKLIAAMISFILLSVVCAVYMVAGFISVVKNFDKADFEMLLLPLFPLIESIFFICVSSSNSLIIHWLWKKDNDSGVENVDADREVVVRAKTFVFLAVLFYVFLGISLLPVFDAVKYALAGGVAIVGGIAFTLFFVALKSCKTEAIAYLKKYEVRTSTVSARKKAKKEAEKEAVKNEILKILHETADKKQAEQEILPDESVAEEKAEKIEASEVEIPSIAEQAPTEPETVEPEADKKLKFDDGFMGDKGGYNANGESDEETRKRRGF